MISIAEMHPKDVDLCFDLDSNEFAFWTKSQWEKEFSKKNVKIFGLFISKQLIGVCALQLVIDEAQINYFAVNQKFRKKGHGSNLMNYLINYCKTNEIKSLLLEVSEKNLIADKFYQRFHFSTVGKRKNYYKDGSSALLKSKKIKKK